MAASNTVFILMKERTGLGPPNKEGEGSWECKIDKGELIIEIPEEERAPKAVKGKLTENYKLLTDPEVIFYAKATDLIPLKEDEFGYLLAVQPSSVRIKEYLSVEKMKEKMELIVSDVVFFKMRVQSHSPEVFVKGVIHYIGPVPEGEGWLFGIEILDERSRGKGYTNGRPHFTCGTNNGVYIAMDKIGKTSQYGSHNEQQKFSETAITGEPTIKAPSGTPADNTRNKVLQLGSKVLDAVKGIDASTHSVDVSNEPSHHSVFQPGQRVILQSVKGDVISGTVRWVGSIRPSKGGILRGGAPIPVVGVETDIVVKPDEHFPDLHLDVTGSLGQSLFKVASGHSRVYVPEQLVICAVEYAENRQKDNNTQYEARLANQFGLSVEEYRHQNEYLEKANLDRDEREGQHTIEERNEEEGPTAGVGYMTGDTRQLEDTMRLAVSGQVGQERIEQERVELEQIKSQQRSNHEEVHSDYVEIEGVRENTVDGSYVNVTIPPNAQGYNSGRGPSPRVSPNLSTGSQGDRSSPRPPPRSSYSPQSQRDSERGSASLPSLQQPPPPEADPHQLTIGSMVCVPTQHGRPLQGVVRWIGTLTEFPGTIGGVELEEPMYGCADGTWHGRRFFHCPVERGYFCPLTALQLDTRYLDEGQVPAHMRQDIQNPLVDRAPVVEEDDTAGGPELFSKYIGEEHGIQGHHNSCYLDSTVFGLFALSESFDELFLKEPQEEVGRKVKYYLWKGIVNPLRKYGLARHESVMDLRNSLEEFGQMKGANRDEKDPEEFLNLLFKDVLHIDPFLSIKRPFGVEKEYFVQLFFEIDPKGTEVPKTEKLLIQMFHEQNISFTRVPSKLLLQMPRFGKEFKMYNRIIPSLILDVKPILDPSALGIQKCHFCLQSPATHECYSCPKEVFNSDEPYLFYCSDCHERVHISRKGHRVEEVTGVRDIGDASQLSKMQLLSVICIETSHYVCYTRTGNRWLFHDSMANRLYDMYNIPKVVDVSKELQEWVYSSNDLDQLMNAPSKTIPEYVRRFTQDIYMCVYVNPDLDLYGDPYESLLLSPTTGKPEGGRRDDDYHGEDSYRNDGQHRRKDYIKSTQV